MWTECVLKWTEAMNTKLLECKREAKDFCTVEGPSEEGGWKKAWLYGDDEAALGQ